MATDKLPIDDLPGDLPEDWKLNDAVTPTGTDAGLSDKHGYNYLMKAVNAAHKKLNALIKALRDNLHAIAYSGSYNDLLNKPSTFPPRTHTHTKVQITDFPTSLPANGGNADTVPWSGVSNKPSVYPPESHSHTPSQVGLGNVSNDAQVKRSEMGVANGVATLDKSGILSLSQLPTSELQIPNLLINGDFQIWQRGKSFSSITSGTYTADRWAVFCENKATKVNVKENSGRLLVNSDGTSRYVLHQRIDWCNSLVNRLKQYNRKLCFSFIVISSIQLEFVSSLNLLHNTDPLLDIVLGSITTQTIAGKSVLVTCECTIPMDVDFNQFRSLQFILCNVASGVTDNLYFYWAKVEYGDVVTPFVPRSYSMELLDCRRFFQQIRFNQSGHAGIGSTGSTQATLALVPYMRGIPVCTLVSEGSNYNISKVTPSVASDRVVLGMVAKAVGYYTVYDYIYQLDAEIY